MVSTGIHVKKMLLKTSSSNRSGFTLIEVLVVVTIITLIAAASMPAYRFIMGSRSLEGTQNITGAMLSRARTASVVDRQVRGVFFFYDVASDRTAMALVQQDGDPSYNPDLDSYKGWTDNSKLFVPSYPAGNPPISYHFGVSNLSAGTSYANKMVFSANEKFSTNAGNPVYNVAKPTLKMFAAKNNHPASNGNAPPSIATWGQTSSLFIDIVPDTDLQLLPAGVGLQLLNDSLITGNANVDRYLRTGCIMFDSNGQLASVEYDVLPSSKLGQLLLGASTNTLAGRVAATVPPVALSNAATLYSQLGFVIYDREQFKAQGFLENDPKFASRLANLTGVMVADPEAGGNEERWLQNNMGPSNASGTSTNIAIPLVVNRYNGTLMRAE